MRRLHTSGAVTTLSEAPQPQGITTTRNNTILVAHSSLLSVLRVGTRSVHVRKHVMNQPDFSFLFGDHSQTLHVSEHDRVLYITRAESVERLSGLPASWFAPATAVSDMEEEEERWDRGFEDRLVEEDVARPDGPEPPLSPTAAQDASAEDQYSHELDWRALREIHDFASSPWTPERTDPTATDLEAAASATEEAQASAAAGSAAGAASDDEQPPPKRQKRI